MMQYSLLGLVLAARLALPVQAQDQLAWNFKDGDNFFVENVAKVKYAMGNGKLDDKPEATSTLVTRYRVVKKTADGAVLEINPLDLKTSGGALAQMMGEKVTKFTFHATVTPTGRVAKFEGFDEYFSKTAGEGELMARIAKRMGAEESLRDGLGLSSFLLPDKPVARGDKWKSPIRLPFNPYGCMKGETEYTYQGAGKEGKTITFGINWVYDLPKEEEDIPQVNTKGDVQTKTGKGTLCFDTVRGRLIRLERTIWLKGEFTMTSLPGDTTTVEHEQVTTSTLRLLDKNPLK